MRHPVASIPWIWHCSNDDVTRFMWSEQLIAERLSDSLCADPGRWSSSQPTSSGQERRVTGGNQPSTRSPSPSNGDSSRIIQNHTNDNNAEPARPVAPFVLQSLTRCDILNQGGSLVECGDRDWTEMKVRISVFGLGYVGTVSSACLARDGHDVLGVDPNMTKVDLINSGRSPIIEKGIEDLVAAAVDAGRLRASDDVIDAVTASDLSLICVGTPSASNGSLDLSHVRTVCEEIGSAMRSKTTRHVVVVRSTMLPGSMRAVVIPALEASSGLVAGDGFGVCNNPEFLREGSAVHDYDNPPKTVIGETDDRSGNLVAELYEPLDAPLFRIPVETAEMVKYSDNVFHALKVGFANEIGNLCKQLDIDSHIVMDIFCQDRKLNLSPYYLKPGFAFGGSCLPKDVRALTYKARTLDLESPILNAIMPSNQQQIERGLSMITASGRKRIGILGFAFKAGTDDLRESPLVSVIENLIGRGFELMIYDRNVNMAALTGANRDFILNVIPHISKLMVDDLQEVLDFAEILVIGNRSEEFRKAVEQASESVTVIDLVRVTPDSDQVANYEGICW